MDLLATDKSPYFAITEFYHSITEFYFLMNVFVKRSDLPLSSKFHLHMSRIFLFIYFILLASPMT